MSLDPHVIPTSSVAALIVAVCFSAGLNVYATVGTLGLVSRLHWVVLPPGLHALSDTWIIAVATILFAVEFVGDKIPALDLVWNAAHSFIRIPVAALVAYGAASQLSPQMQLVATVGGGLLAAIAHSSKTAARVLVTPSPEPVSNVALSASEDAAAIGLTFIATHHPFVAASIVGVVLCLILLSVRWLIQRTQAMWSRRPTWLVPRQLT